MACNSTPTDMDDIIHFWTQYHLDIVCPRMNVLTDEDIYLIGPNNANTPKMNVMRNSNAKCPCLD